MLKKIYTFIIILLLGSTYFLLPMHLEKQHKDLNDYKKTMTPKNAYITPGRVFSLVGLIASFVNVCATEQYNDVVSVGGVIFSCMFFNSFIKEAQKNVPDEKKITHVDIGFQALSR